MSDSPLKSLKRHVEDARMTLPAGLPPMAVGLFGYLGYDMVRQMERLPSPPPDTLGLPDAILLRPTITAIFDNVRDEIIVVTPVWPDAKSMRARPMTAPPSGCRPWSPIWTTGRRRLRRLPPLHRRDRRNPTRRTPSISPWSRRPRNTSAPAICFRSCPASASAAHSRCRPSRSIARCAGSIPSPFLYYLAFPGFAIVGSSPEILVRLRDGKVTIRPIAGTRPRGKTPEEDRRWPTS